MKETLLKLKILGLGLTLLSPSAFGAPGDVLAGAEFNTPGDLEGFSDAGDKLAGFDGTGEEAVVTNSDGDGVLAFQIAAGDPQLNLGSLSLEARFFGRAEVRMRQSDGSGGWLPSPIDDDLLFFGGVGSQGQPVQTADPAAPVGSGWVILEWDLESLAVGVATSLRVDPGNILGASIEIDYIRLIESDTPRDFSGITIDPSDPLPSGLVERYAVEFNTDGNFEGVSVNGNFTNAAVTGGALTGVVASTSGDANFTIPEGGLEIPVTAANDAIYIEVGFTTSGNTGQTFQVFWGDTNGGIAGGRSSSATIPAVAGAKVARFASVGNALVNTELRKLRIDPTNQPNEPLSIDYVRVYSDPEAVVIPTAWDTNESLPGVQGGSGTWDTVANLFNTDGTNAPWPSVSTGEDDATFSDVGGTVSLDASGITANELIFTVNGYEIAGPGVLTLDGVDPSFTVGNGVSATVSAIIDSASDIVKDDLGELLLIGTQEPGSVRIKEGILTIPSGSFLAPVGTGAGDGFALKTQNATLNIDGELDTTAGGLGGFSGDGPFTINVNAGGELTSSGIVMGWNDSATINLEGTSNVTGNVRHQDGGNSTLNVLGGLHTVSSFVGRQANGGGTTNINVINGELIADRVTMRIGYAGNPAGANTMNVDLDGGTLTVDNINLDRGPTGTATSTTTLNLAFNGGTLKALESGTSLDLIREDLGQAIGTETFNLTVSSGGAIIDTNGLAKRIGHPFVDGASSGSLTKIGAGPLLLTGANTYSGGTTLSDGSLGGDGSILGGLTVPGGSGLALRMEDPSALGSGLDVGGALVLPSSLLIQVVSSTAPYPEADATGVVVATGTSVSGFNAASVTFDTSNFSGTGTFTARQEGNSIVVDYVAGEPQSPLITYLTDAGLSGDDLLATADPDGDGDNNLAEFAFGTNPNDSGSSVAAFFFIEEVAGDFVVSFPVRAPLTQALPLFAGSPSPSITVDGIVITVRGSVDLVTFETLVTEVNPALIFDDPLNPTIPEDYFFYSFKLATPIAGAAKGFIQVQVTEEAPPA